MNEDEKNKEMKWMSLKNYLSPTFMKEIEKVSEIYMSNYQ